MQTALRTFLNYIYRKNIMTQLEKMAVLSFVWHEAENACNPQIREYFRNKYNQLLGE